MGSIIISQAAIGISTSHCDDHAIKGRDAVSHTVAVQYTAVDARHFLFFEHGSVWHPHLRHWAILIQSKHIPLSSDSAHTHIWINMESRTVATKQNQKLVWFTKQTWNAPHFRL